MSIRVGLSRPARAFSMFLSLSAAGCASSGAGEAWERCRDWGQATPAVDTRPSGELGAPAAPVSLEELLRIARSRNPGLKAAFSRWKAAILDVSRATRWPEPEVSYTAFIGAGMMPVMMQRHQLVLKYSVPWPTRYGHAERAALQRAAAAEQGLHDLTREVERRVVEGWLELWRVRAVRALRAEQVAVVRGLVEAATGLLKTGGAGLAEVQRLKVAELLATDALASLDAEEARVSAMLGAAMGGVEASPEIAGRPDDLHAWLEGATVSALAARLLDHPKVAAMAREAEAMEHAARAEETEALPMVGLEAGWMEMSPGATPDLGTGADIFMFGVMLRVPLWQGSYADAADAMRASGQAVREEAEALRHALHAALASEVAALADARRRGALYRDALIPHVEDAYASIVGGWSAGRGELDALLGLQQQMLDLRIMALDADVDAARARVRLAELVGPDEGEGDSR